MWHYSTLRAGLAITPGPLVVAGLSRRPAGWPPDRLPARARGRRRDVRRRPAAATSWWSRPNPQYLLHWLPASLLVGLGVALTFPVLSAAAVAGIPATRFGVGGAINQTARQLGAVLGVALLVALLGTPSTPADTLVRFRRVWLMCAGAAFVSAVISMAHERRGNVVTPEPVHVSDAVAA